MWYGISTWCADLTVQLNPNLSPSVWCKLPWMSWERKTPSLCEQSILKQANKILSDPSHTRHAEYELFPPARRYPVFPCRLNCFENSSWHILCQMEKQLHQWGSIHEIQCTDSIAFHLLYDDNMAHWKARAIITLLLDLQWKAIRGLLFETVMLSDGNSISCYTAFGFHWCNAAVSYWNAITTWRVVDLDTLHRKVNSQ